MENATRFDLNESIARWRMELANSPAFRPEDMDELETHLRDSVSRLEGKGLSADEAFWVAKNRMGTTDSLDAEFGKINAADVWANRVLWMVIGTLGIGILGSIASLLRFASVIAINKLSAPGWVLNLTSCLVYIIGLIGLCYWGWRSGTRSFGKMSRASNWMGKRPKTTGVIVLLFTAVLYFGVSLSIGTVYRNLTPEMMGSFSLWHMYSSMILGLLLWPCVLTWLLVRKTRKTVQ